MHSIESSSGHGETVGRLLDALGRRGLSVFAQFDHAAAARDAGLELPNELVVVFGDPRSGTPLMQQDPRSGIELPLRILVWDHGEHTRVGYNDPRDLADRYEVAAHLATLKAMSSLLEQLAQEAAAGG